jgi:hypothetical protein
MKKFYRYLIYKLYSWGLKKKGDTPIANAIITLTFVHYVQLFTLYMILLRFIPAIDVFSKIDKKYVGVFLVMFGITHYFIIYHKQRWEGYLEEFKNETPQERKRGSILVLAYLIGSILLFFILMPILFGI